MAAMLTCVACRKSFASNIPNCPNCGLPREASMSAPPAAPPPIVPGGAPAAAPRGAIGSRPSFFNSMNSGCMARLVILGAVAVIGTVIGIGIWISNEFPSMHVVNTTSGPVSVWVDGKLKKDGIPPTAFEDKSAIRDVRLTKGSHLVEAKDDSGRVISHQTIEVGHGDRMLFAPGHGDSWCFAVETAEYGTVAYGLGGNSSQLDPAQDFWNISGSVDRWLEDSPQTKEVDSAVGFTTDTAVRMLHCE